MDESAGAATRAKLAEIPAAGGAGPGALANPRSLAVNRNGVGGAGVGDVYILDNNNRISQFSTSGTSPTFVRAFGQDVLASVNEQQLITVVATGGTFTLTYDGETTAAINFDATGAQVATVLAALPKIGAGNVAGSGGGTEAKTITFQGALAGTNVPQMTANSAGLTGGAATATTQTLTQGSGGSTGFEVCGPTDSCKAGTASALAGSVNTAQGIAIDQATGLIYVASTGNRRIDVFSATGAVEGAFGWGVKAGVESVSALQFCSTAGTGCQAGVSTSEAGGIATSASTPRNVSFDSSGNLYVPDPGNLRFDVFTPILAAGKVAGATFVRGIGWKVNKTAPIEQLQECTVLTGCQAGSEGTGEGQFTANNPTSVAVDSTNAIYAVSTGNCATALCRIQKFSAAGSIADANFGPASGECSTDKNVGFSTGPNGSGVQTITIEPLTDRVLVLRRSLGPAARVCELDSSGNEVSISPSTSLTVGTAATAGLAMGTGERIFVSNGAPAVYILGPVPPPSCAEVLPTTEVGQTSAKLNGRVCVPSPGGDGFNTTYRFELSANGGFTWTNAPTPDASAGSVAGPVVVQQIATGLQPNANYLVRVRACTGPCVTSAPPNEPFSTGAAPPSIRYALGANSLTDVINPFGASNVKLAGYVNPNNSLTSYRVEYGKTMAYGLESPSEFEPFIGSGGTPQVVKATLTGLEPATTYYFRIVATNASGKTEGSDQRFTTASAPEGLNACGLPANRCFEMISPRDKGPVGAVEPGSGGLELQSQAALQGPSVAYAAAGGFPGVTTGPESVYLADRDSGRWTSVQMSPPFSSPSQLGRTTLSDSAVASLTKMLSDDLSCGVVASGLPLSPAAPAQTIAEGGSNLFVRDNATGNYAVITDLPPVNGVQADPIPLTDKEYELIGMSQDCDDVVFASPYRYPGIGGAGTSHVYQWSNGAMHDVGIIPGPGATEVPAAAVPGAGVDNHWRTVSSDGSRVTFSATRAYSPNPTEIGKVGVFVREDGLVTRDVSRSETGTASGNATYQTASKDGSKVFFSANAGLTAASSAAGSDLYEYDLGSSDLTNLSIDPDSGGAAVAGVLGASDDGTYVYFAAKGQLVPEKGRTFSENSEAATLSVYLSHAGVVKYVGAIRAADLPPLLGSAKAGVSAVTTSRVAAGGKRLIFNTSANVTGYLSGGAAEAYLYDAESNATVCVTCYRNGAPFVGSQVQAPTGESRGTYWSHAPASITTDGSHIFFASRDPLAPGASPGRRNLYEWIEGQTYLIASVPASESLNFRDAASDGQDVYIATTAQLNDEDVDGRADLYDARKGGGFPSAPPAALPCNPLVEGACAVLSTPVGAMPVGGSATVVGLGNEKPKKQKSKEKKKKKRQQKKQKGKRSQNRSSNNGGAGK